MARSMGMALGGFVPSGLRLAILLVLSLSLVQTGSNASGSPAPAADPAAPAADPAAPAADPAAPVTDPATPAVDPAAAAATGAVPDPGASFQGGVTTDDASAHSAKVPSDASATAGEDSPQSLANYHESVLNWFLLWLTQNGVDASVMKVVLDYNRTLLTTSRARPEMYVLAARNISAGEVLFELPTSVQAHGGTYLLEESPYKPDYAFNASEDLERGGWSAHTALAAWLLREKAAGDSSPWAAYIGHLPQYVPLPVYFRDEVLEELQLPALHDQVKSYLLTFEQEYERCRPEALAHASRDEFFWALSITVSRAFTAADNGPVLLPLADLLNHYNDYNALWQIDNEGKFIFTARNAIAAGEEIKNQYGAKSSDTLFTIYGFVLSDNEHDNFVLLDNSIGGTIPASARNASTDFYRLYFEQGQFGPEHEQWLEFVSGKAQEAVEQLAPVEKQEYKGELEVYRMPRFNVESDTDPIALWHGAAIDPRLLTVVASVWYFFAYSEEPPYETVARLSLWYGWNIYSGTCHDLAVAVGATDKVERAFQAAVDAVAVETKQQLEQMTNRTTIEEDSDYIASLKVCVEKEGTGKAWEEEELGRKGGEEDGDEAAVEERKRKRELREYCESVSGEAAARLTVIRLRLMKKRLLKDVLDRIKETCPQREEEQGDGEGKAEGGDSEVKGSEAIPGTESVAVDDKDKKEELR